MNASKPCEKMLVTPEKICNYLERRRPFLFSFDSTKGELQFCRKKKKKRKKKRYKKERKREREREREERERARREKVHELFPITRENLYCWENIERGARFSSPRPGQVVPIDSIKQYARSLSASLLSDFARILMRNWILRLLWKSSVSPAPLAFDQLIESR